MDQSVSDEELATEFQLSHGLLRKAADAPTLRRTEFPWLKVNNTKRAERVQRGRQRRW